MRPIWSRSEANQLLVQAELLPVCVRGRRPRLRKRGRTGSSPLEGCKSAARRTAPSSGPCFLSRFMPTVTPTPCRVPGQFRRRKSAVKVHTLVDLRGTIPPSDYVIPQRGTRCTTSTSWTSCSPNPRPSICWIGARHFASLYVLKQVVPSSVTRAKQNTQFYRRAWRPADGSTGLRSDQTIRLTGPKTGRPLSRTAGWFASRCLHSKPVCRPCYLFCFRRN